MNLPNRVLGCAEVGGSRLVGESWPYNDGTGDPWWTGGSNPKPYRWTIELNITSQQHGSHLTREPYYYTAYDVQVGDWVADTNTGISVKVIEILDVTSDTNITMKVEDVDRYNTFQDSLGNGIFDAGASCVLFQLSDEDSPILEPLPPQVSQVNFVTQVNARFSNTDPIYTYRFFQTSHNFENSIGKAVWVNPSSGKFEVSTGSNASDMAGTVKRIVGPDIFYLVPTTRVVENIANPILPGSAGQYIYVNPSGDLTNYSMNLPPIGSKKAYLQLTNAIPDYVVGTVAGGTTTASNQMKINNVLTTFSGTSLASVINDINAGISSHRVSASSVLTATSAQTNISNTVYSLVFAIGTSMTATINSVLVHFNITTHGSAAYSQANTADSVDMATAINNANIPNITADGGTGGSSGVLTITNSVGGSITIVNGTSDSDTNGNNPFAGTNSCTGLPLSTSASAGLKLELINADGTGIRLQNVVGDTIGDFGIRSVVNGFAPLGLIVEQAVGTSSGGENPGVDPSVFTLTISGVTPTTVVVPDGTRIESITVEVTTAFDDLSSFLYIVDDHSNTLMLDSDLDLSVIGTYNITSNVFYQYGVSVTITPEFDPGSSTAGSATLTITYI